MKNLRCAHRLKVFVSKGYVHFKQLEENKGVIFFPKTGSQKQAFFKFFFTDM